MNLDELIDTIENLNKIINNPLAEEASVIMEQLQLTGIKQAIRAMETVELRLSVEQLAQWRKIKEMLKIGS